ncbi:MAG: ATP-binding cassette, subfamily bacterial [Actinomycetota bacterium]
MKFAEWRRLVATYLLPHRRIVSVLAGALFFTIGLEVATPQIVRLFIDRATSPSGGSLALLTVLYVGAVLVQQVFGVVTAWLSEVVGWLTTNDLRADLMAHCLSLDPDFHETHPPGELIERVDGDLTGLSLFFAQFLLNVVGSTLLLTGVLIVVWTQSAYAGTVLTLFAAMAVTQLVLARRVAANAWGRSRETSAALFGYIEERLAGIEDIRSLGGEQTTLRGFYARARDRLWTTSRARQMDAVGWANNAFIQAVSNGVAFVVPTVLVQRGSITVGSAFALYFYAQLLMQPLDNMSHQVEALQQAIAGGRRVLALLAIKPRIFDGPGDELGAGPLGVSLHGVSFGYGDDPDILHDLTLEVPAGSVLGIVGRTGSGKSSLARLLVRFYDPRQGTITIDGTDLRQLKRHQLRERVALVTQEVNVLRATVRDNLTLFDAAVPDEAIVAALRLLDLGRWLDALPDGLDSVVGEGGAGLSAGEAQLLSFGRAFLSDPSIIILDEASSRLDPATETVLEHAVDAMLEGRTGILIAHRLATLERCDTICVLDHGRIVEFGARSVLAQDPTSRFGALLRTGLDVVPG